MELVRFDKVSKIYRTGKVSVEALKDVSVAIESSEFISIAGPSGSGKTTFLNLVGCLDVPTKGAIYIDGVLTETLSPNQRADLRRENIGFIFQAYNLIPVLSAYENVELALVLLPNISAAERRLRTESALSDVGLIDLKERKPMDMSGGQQQRVAIARALVKQPKLILADEPTANLDSKTGEQSLNLMLKLNEKFGTTFIFSTHDLMVMSFAKRLIKIHDGKIVSDERRASPLGQNVSTS